MTARDLLLQAERGIPLAPAAMKILAQDLESTLRIAGEYVMAQAHGGTCYPPAGLVERLEALRG